MKRSSRWTMSAAVVGALAMLLTLTTVVAAKEPPPEPPPCPEEPGTRSMGFYKNHPEVVQLADPKHAEFILNLLWTNKAAKGANQHLNLDKAVTVLGLNVRVFGIESCTLEQLGLSSEKLGLPPDKADWTVGQFRSWVKENLADAEADGFPLSPRWKEKLTFIYEIIDVINNSNTDVPLPEEYA